MTHTHTHEVPNKLDSFRFSIRFFFSASRSRCLDWFRIDIRRKKKKKKVKEAAASRRRQVGNRYWKANCNVAKSSKNRALVVSFSCLSPLVFRSFCSFFLCSKTSLPLFVYWSFTYLSVTATFSRVDSFHNHEIFVGDAQLFHDASHDEFLSEDSLWSPARQRTHAFYWPDADDRLQRTPLPKVFCGHSFFLSNSSSPFLPRKVERDALLDRIWDVSDVQENIGWLVSDSRLSHPTQFRGLPVSHLLVFQQQRFGERRASTRLLEHPR